MQLSCHFLKLEGSAGCRSDLTSDEAPAVDVSDVGLLERPPVGDTEPERRCFRLGEVFGEVAIMCIARLPAGMIGRTGVVQGTCAVSASGLAGS